MTKYLISRILRAVFSIIIVVGVVMTMIYTFLDKRSIFADDPVFTKQKNNGQQVYMMQQWERYGYLDYVHYSEFVREKLRNGEIDQATYDVVVKIGNKESADSAEAQPFIQEFIETYRGDGYEIERMDAVMQGRTKKYKDGGAPQLFAYKNISVFQRLLRYIPSLVVIDNINTVEEDVGQRGLTFTWRDPAYGGEKFSPAIMGNGTHHKYLLYCDDNFPYIHQNLIKINLGLSFSVNKGIDVFDTMTLTQGSYVRSMVTYPTGLQELSADDLHSATYVAGSLASGSLNAKYFTDDYTSVTTVKAGMSKMGYSFSIGIIAVILSYFLAVPLGITMALRKDKLLDKLGTFYIVFVTAVPSLAYIFMFKSFGGSLGLPTTFDMERPTRLMYVLPIISLALPSVANLMKWLRRYMIDQMNSDYVKFARSGGLSEGEIFSKHILKNAIIPIVHGIPGSVLGAMTGAIITERVYVVPGAGNMLTNAINKYDNGVIVGMTLFYAVLTVTSIILGDVLMSLVDPRISFTSKAR